MVVVVVFPPFEQSGITQPFSSVFSGHVTPISNGL